MQFQKRQKKRELISSRGDFYPLALQFYKNAPTHTVTLEEFEDLALERLKVLRLFEKAGAKYNKTSHDYKTMITSGLRTQKLSHYCKISLSENVKQDEKVYEKIQIERKRDHVSHFILRLAYCRRDDLRRWFIAQEVDMFRFRFTCESDSARASFIEQNNLKCNQIDETEKFQLKEHLYLGYGHSMPKVMATNFYKVSFLDVLDLVKNRKVFIENGFAYIPEEDLVVTVLSAYRTHLSHALAVTSRALPSLEEDTRLISMLNTLHQRYIGTDYGNKKATFTGEIAPGQIDELSKSSFPLCMRNLHDTLRKSHHLKYNGRLQYGLFLKGIGLSLEDALRFWREEFTKVMDIDKFDKQYTYNIRYNYGKEGKRANFSPYSCMKIITTNNPGPGEHHGCPFKHSDKSNLKQMLQNLHISNAGIDSILDLSKDGHYQVACTRFFEVTHSDNRVDQGINHPNQYFEESKRILTGVIKEKVVKQPFTKLSTNKSTVINSQKSTELEDNFEEMDDIEEVLSSLSGID